MLGTSAFETGGAGTAFVESISPTGAVLKQTLTINNNGHPYPKAAVISAGPLRHIRDGIYDDISAVGGVTWLDQEHDTYNFNHLVISGNAHVAILSDSWGERVQLNVNQLFGDMTAVLHIGMNQTANIIYVAIYMPAHVAAYKYVNP